MRHLRRVLRTGMSAFPYHRMVLGFGMLEFRGQECPLSLIIGWVLGFGMLEFRGQECPRSFIP